MSYLEITKTETTQIIAQTRISNSPYRTNGGLFFVKVTFEILVLIHLFASIFTFFHYFQVIKFL